MSKRKIIENSQLSFPIDLSDWPNVNVDRLTEDDKEVYFNRRTAIEMYYNGHSHQEIENKTGIHRNKVARMVNRCLQPDDQGIPWGYRALIPRKRIRSYTRELLPEANDQNMSGAFQLLLETYPTIRDVIHQLFFKKKKISAADPVTRGKEIHRAFVKSCRQVGLKAPNNYPFNTIEMGRRSLYAYLRSLEDKEMLKAAERLGSEEARLLQYTGTGNEQNYNQVIRPFEKVQFDGHKIDLFAVLVLKSPEGDDVYIVIDRIWLLVIFDIATRAIISSHVSFNREYSGSDVLMCIRNGVVPWKPKILTIPGLQYPVDGGYPSAVIPKTEWALWDEIQFDQAKANLSNLVKDRLKQVVKCRINPGRVRFPIGRSHIERWFGIFEENGFHRLPSTTGSNPNDPRRVDPAKLAIKHRITVQHIEELVDVMIADYNGTPHEGVNFSTPLEAMKNRLNTYSVNQMPEEQRNEVAFLSLQATRQVKGNPKHGRRPYIQYENVRYTNELLARSPGLIGKKLDIMVNVDDLRVVTAYLPDGSQLGKLKATGKWSLSPHTLQVRQEIFRLKNKKLIRFASADNPIEIYQQYLNEGAKTNRRKASKAHEINRNMDRNTINTENLLIQNLQMNFESNHDDKIIDQCPKKSDIISDEEVKYGNSRKLNRAIVY